MELANFVISIIVLLGVMYMIFKDMFKIREVPPQVVIPEEIPINKDVDPVIKYRTLHEKNLEKEKKLVPQIEKDIIEGNFSNLSNGNYESTRQ